MTNTVKMLQMAYVVDSIEDAAMQWHRTLGIGPFYWGDSSRIVNSRYRGADSQATFRFALGYCGDLQIELIELTNDAPSVYREKVGDTGTGFHHFMPVTEDFNATIAAYEAAGAPVVFSNEVRGGKQVVYVDGRKQFGSFIEIADMDEEFRQGEAKFKALCQRPWDGTDLVRSFASLSRKREA